MITRILRYLILIIACLGLLHVPLASCKPIDAQYESFLLAKRKVFERLHENLPEPLISRVQKMPDDFLKTLRSYDSSIGILDTARYTARTLSAEQISLFKSYADLLPAAYQRVFNSKLLAVYFVDNFAGAGLTEWVIDHEGRTYYYLILNSLLLDTSIDEWLSYKENSSFDKSASSPNIRVIRVKFFVV